MDVSFIRVLIVIVLKVLTVNKLRHPSFRNFTTHFILTFMCVGALFTKYCKVTFVSVTLIYGNCFSLVNAKESERNVTSLTTTQSGGSLNLHV